MALPDGSAGVSWILTYTGKRFDLVDPRPSDVNIIDIAHALANSGRFAGHTRSFYPIAQHCVLGSYLVPIQFARAFLLHDAREAYVGDVSSPLKQLLPEYHAIEERVATVVDAAFEIPATVAHAPEIKHADLVMLATERRDLMPSDPAPWPCLAGIEPMAKPIRPWTPSRAKAAFLQRYIELTDLARRAA